MKNHHRAFLSGVALAVAAATLTPPALAQTPAQLPAQVAQATDLNRFLPKPPRGWASEDRNGLPALPNQAMGMYYRENGDGGDAVLMIVKQQSAAPTALGNRVPGAAPPASGAAGSIQEIPVEVNGFRGKLAKQEDTQVLTVPVGGHAIIITTSGDTKTDDVVALARAVDTASLAKR